MSETKTEQINPNNQNNQSQNRPGPISNHSTGQAMYRPVKK
jgi:hypothetical protein